MHFVLRGLTGSFTDTANQRLLHCGNAAAPAVSVTLTFHLTPSLKATCSNSSDASGQQSSCASEDTPRFVNITRACSSRSRGSLQMRSLDGDTRSLKEVGLASSLYMRRDVNLSKCAHRQVFSGAERRKLACRASSKRSCASWAYRRTR